MFFNKKVIFFAVTFMILLLTAILPVSAGATAPVKVVELSGYTLEDNIGTKI